FPEEMPDIEETGSTFIENARLKAEGIAKMLKKPVIADDSGLEVAALEGRPGVYSARFAGEPKDDTRNNNKLLHELNATTEAKRQAQINCVLALSIPGEETNYEERNCKVSITKDLTGDEVYGYEYLFILKGYN